MRQRDPRRLLRTRRAARARVRLIEAPGSGSAPDGSISTRQCAEVTLPREEFDRVWSPEYLERLARTYWAYLTRISLGTLRVLYTPDAREIAFLTRPFVLLRFHKPEYEVTEHGGAVTWPIDRGLLVQPPGRGKGFLRIAVERGEEREGGSEVAAVVSSEVANFYPLIAGWGWFSRVGRVLYRATQLRIHVLVTNGFLRSLAALDLEPSVVGALRHATLATFGRASGDRVLAEPGGARLAPASEGDGRARTTAPAERRA